MPEPGEVLCDDQFQFSDGTKGKKLFIVLNNAGVGEPCLVVKTTSQVRRYTNTQVGCNPQKKVFYVITSAGVFTQNTFIQLDEIFPYHPDELLTGYWQKRIKQVSKLPDLILRQLKNCLKKLKQDIPEKYYRMIFAKS